MLNDLLADLKSAKQIQQERNKLLEEISKELGIDISFSEEALMKEINDLASKKMRDRIEKVVVESMKSLSL
jgi:hypothetical protein|tara:strand:- start:695 stop:907 length:213 start_codon:yes stop_codon:yes gene_type:complete